MVKLVISGIAGRMGQRIFSLAKQDKDFEIISGLEVRECEGIGLNVESDFAKVARECDVLVEFTTPTATMEHLALAVKNKVSMVIGTTALSSDELQKIKDAATKIPIVFSPNMSVGANLLFRLTEDVAMALKEDYEIKIVEAHHTKKKDAPSGTAKRLGEVVCKVKGEVPPIESIREGDIVGDHTVIFEGVGERIELTHRALSRDAFAKGALDAAKFVAGKKPGLYSMEDVIKGTLSKP